MILIIFLLGSLHPSSSSKEKLRLRVPNDFGLEARSCPARVVQTTLLLLCSYCQGSSKFNLTLEKQLPGCPESLCAMSRYIGQVWRRPRNLHGSLSPTDICGLWLGLFWPPGEPCSTSPHHLFHRIAGPAPNRKGMFFHTDGGLTKTLQQRLYRKEDGQQIK